MSDAFTDHEYESEGIWNGPDELKIYCPPKGVRMRFKKIENENPTSGFQSVYYKAVITSGAAGTAATPIIQKAIYFDGGSDRLVATNIELPGNMLMNEVIKLVRDPKSNEVTGLDHQLSFWHGVVASWPCGRH